MTPLSSQLYSSKPSSHLHYSFSYSFYSIHQQIRWCYLRNLSQLLSLQSSQWYHHRTTYHHLLRLVWSFPNCFPCFYSGPYTFLPQKWISVLFQRNKFDNIVSFLKILRRQFNSLLWPMRPTWRGPSLPCSLCFSHTGFLSLPSTSPNCSHLKILALDFALCLECPTPPCGRFLLIILISIQKSPNLLWLSYLKQPAQPLSHDLFCFLYSTYYYQKLPYLCTDLLSMCPKENVNSLKTNTSLILLITACPMPAI